MDWMDGLMKGLDSLTATPEARMQLRMAGGQSVPTATAIYDVQSQAEDKALARQQAAAQQAALAQMAGQDFTQGFNPDVMRGLISSGMTKEAMQYYKATNEKQTMQPVTLPDGTVMGYDKYSNTMTPAQMAGQQAAGNWQTEYEMPVSDMMGGLSPKGQLEAEKAQIAAGAPLTRYQQEQLEEQKARREQDRINKEQDRLLNPNEGQSKSFGFLERMAQAEQNLSSIPLDPFVSRTNSVLSALPFGNSMVSDDYQRAKQAETDFITAVLRKESGAAIGEAEYERERTKYFPIAGDTPAVIKQKAESRAAAMRGMAKGAGALAQDFQLPEPVTFEQVKPQQTQTSGAPQIGAVEDGYKFKGGNPADPNNWEEVR